jgi:hypothetical protein
MVKIFFILLSFGLATAENKFLSVVELNRGAGENQVGLMDEGEAYGPNRLCARAGKLYLLDRINHRVLVYDYNGVQIKQHRISFDPADLALDSKGCWYLLENRTEMNFVKVYQGDSLTREYRFLGDVREPVTEIGIDRKDRLMIKKGTKRFYFNSANDWLEDDEHWNIQGELIGEDAKGNVYTVEIAGRKEGSEYRYHRQLWCYGSNQVSLVLDDLPKGYFSYDLGSRDVAIDEQGNIFQFQSCNDGTGRIIRWVYH